LGAEIFFLLLLCASVAVPFPRLLRLDSIPLSVDTPAFHFPLWRFLLDTMRGGELPLWCPGIYMGYPLHAYGEGGLLYPPHYLALLLPSPGACVAFLLLFHHIVAAVGAYLLCRVGFLLSPVASLAGGFCFSLSGYMVLRQVSAGFFSAASWAPLCLLVSLPWVYKKRPFLASLVLLLPLVSGHALAWVMSLLLWGALNVGASLRDMLSGEVRAGLFGLLRVAGTFALHLLLGAAQLLPGAEFSLHSPRAKGLTLKEASLLSMGTEHLPLLVAPWLCGDWGGPFCPPYAFAFGAWVGLGGLLLALFGLFMPETRRRALLPVGLAVIGLWTALGPKAGLFLLLHKLPGLKIFRCPSHFLLWWCLGLSALVALGVEAVVRGNPRAFLPLRISLLSSALGCIGWTAHMEAWGSSLPALALVLAQGAFPPSARPILLLPLWGEVALEARQVRRFMRAWRLEEPPSIAKVLLASDGHVRALNPAGGDRRFLETALKGQMGLLWRLKILVEPGKPMPPLRYALAFPRLLKSPRLRRAAAVRFLILRSWDWPGAKRVMARGPDVLLSIPEEAPFLRLAGRAEVAETVAEALKLTEEAPPSAVVVEAPHGMRLPPLSGDGNGRAVLLSERANSVVISVESPSHSLLIVSQMWYPGWKAWVDGRSAWALPADFLATAVPVPAGSRLVWLAFHPSTFSVGLYISLLSLAGLLAAFAALKLLSKGR